jgi:hypothetical protein
LRHQDPPKVDAIIDQTHETALVNDPHIGEANVDAPALRVDA